MHLHGSKRYLLSHTNGGATPAYVSIHTLVDVHSQIWRMHVQANAGKLKIDIPQDLCHALFCVLFAYVNSRLLHPIALVLHGPRRLRNFQLLGPVS